MKNTPVAANRIDLMFKAFSDKTRLRILSLLRDGECCVGDLVEVLGIEQSSTSRHLAYLRKAALVEVRKAGLWKYYSLAPARGAFHTKLLDCLDCCFQEVPQIRADQIRAKQLRKSSGCCPETPRGERKKKAEESKMGEKSGRCCSDPED